MLKEAELSHVIDFTICMPFAKTESTLIMFIKTVNQIDIYMYIELKGTSYKHVLTGILINKGDDEIKIHYLNI